MALSGKAKSVIIVLVLLISLALAALVIWYLFYRNPMVGTGLDTEPTLDPFPTTTQFVNTFDS